MAAALAEGQVSNPFTAAEPWDWLAPVVFEPDAGSDDRERSPMSDTDSETFRAYAAYADEDGVCFPSQATIADDLGVCLKTVQRRTRRLIEGGHMRIVERRWSPFSRHRHNVSQLLSVDLCPVSDLGRKRVTRRAHARRGESRTVRARRAIRRGLVGMGCPTKRREGTRDSRPRRVRCRCRACREELRRFMGPSPTRLALRRWRPTGPRWRDELARRLRRAGRDPDMAYELLAFDDPLPPPRIWSGPAVT